MSKVKSFKVKQTDGTFSAPFVLGADAENIDLKKGKNLEAEMLNANPLLGKTALFFGDDFCAGQSVGEIPEKGLGWAGLIGEANSMKWKNFGENGAVMAPLSEQDKTIVKQMTNAYGTFSREVDFVILEGGYNDIKRLNLENLGEIDYSKWNLFDKNFFIGAFEETLSSTHYRYPFAKIGYIIPPKFGHSPYVFPENKARVFYEKAIATCEKWGVPYLDLWGTSFMNPDFQAIEVDPQPGSADYVDDNLLTLQGYKKITYQIEAWMKTMASSGASIIGKTPQKGVDYWTQEDQTKMVQDTLAALPKWTGGSY